MIPWMVAVALAAGPGPELHVVSVYESYARVAGGGKVPVRAQVVVNRPGKDVTLFVSGYEPVTWQVIVAPGTNLKKVILGGSHRQAAEVPKGVEVVEMFGEGRAGQPSIRADYKIDSDRLRQTVRAIHKLTGQEVASHQGSYNYDPLKPIVVKAVQNDERLRSDYPRVAPAKDLPKVAFRATHLAPVDRFGFAASFGDFTQTGPDRNTLTALPKGVLGAAYDPVGKKHYGLTWHEIYEVDLAKGAGEKMDPGPAVPKLSWPCGITYDTKRDLLVVATLGGVGHLYTYSPKTGAWAAVGLNNIDLSALAYHPKDDTLYGLADARDGGGGGRPTLYRFNAQGALLGQSQLDGPLLPGAFAPRPGQSRVQLVSSGDYLAALVHLQNRDENGRGAGHESFLYLIDPKTGKAPLAWKE